MAPWGSRLSLDGRFFEVVIVGGGINGVAIAREFALAGRSALLLEQHDFASGTTSRSTRIIHGGLRYLEYGEISLVRQSLRERQRLLAERRHLVRPLHFLLALPRGHHGRNALELRLGLWLYRRLSRSRPTRENLSHEIHDLEASLDAERRWAVFAYDDAQCEFPERLVAEWLTDAVAAGAVARNYTEALEVELRQGRVTAVVVRDTLNDEEARVETTRVINASGPWADRLCGRSSIDTRSPLIGGIRGSHIILTPFAGAPNAAVYTEAIDGRPIFLVPWNGQWLLGTTEVRDDNDPAHVQPTQAELEYLLSSVRGLFPQARIGMENFRAAFAGVRPLPFAPGANPAAVTRRHLLHDHSEDGARGLISILGGKLTTAAAVARECVRQSGADVEESETLVLPAPRCDGIHSALDDWASTVAGRAGISMASARAMAQWYGRRALSVADRARADAKLRQPLCPHTDHLLAEAFEAVQSEAALTLGDILLRRVPVALGGCWSAECSRIAAHRIGAVLGWTDRQTGTQLEHFENERQAFLRPAVVSNVRLRSNHSQLPTTSEPSKSVA